MDFYAPDVKWIRNQKNIETKLFNELIVSHTKKICDMDWVVACDDCDDCGYCDNCEDIDLISSNNIHELFKVRGREYYYIFLKGSNDAMFKGKDKHNPVIAHISPYLYRTLNV